MYGGCDESDGVVDDDDDGDSDDDLKMYLVYRLEATIHHIMFWRASAAPVVNTLVPLLEHLASEPSIFTSNFMLMTSICFHCYVCCGHNGDDLLVTVHCS